MMDDNDRLCTEILAALGDDELLATQLSSRIRYKGKMGELRDLLDDMTERGVLHRWKRNGAFCYRKADKHV